MCQPPGGHRLKLEPDLGAVEEQCPGWLSVTVTDTMAKSSLEGKAVFDLQVTAHHGRKPNQEPGGRN